MAGKTVEIRWHARGGQGAKSAAIMVAEVALEESKFGQGCPDYGPERRGAPTRGYTRISDSPIRAHCAIATPDVVVVLDETLIGPTQVCEGMKEGGTVLVNTGKSPAEIRRRLGLSGGKVYTIDATQVSLDTIGRPIPNTPMIGALIKATGVLKLDTILHDVEKKFGRKGAKIVQGNKDAIRRAYEEVKTE